LSALSIGWFGWDKIFERFASLKNAQGVIYEHRLDFWEDTREIISHYALTGSGMGTFPHVYPLHRSFTSDRFLSHAHNDYLELLAEGGMIGFLIAAAFLATLFRKTYTVFTRRRDAFSVYLYIGCVTAMTSSLLHSFTDFNMHIGANGLWFFFVAGIAVSAANTGMRKQSRETRLVPITSASKKILSFVMVLILAVSSIAFNISNLLGIFYYSNVKDFAMDTTTSPDIIQKVEKVATLASRFDPFVAEYSFITANTAWFLNDIDRSRSLFNRSVCLAPLNSRILNQFGKFLAGQGDGSRAKIAFEKSMQYDQSNAEFAFQYAAWLISTGSIDPGLTYMNKTLTLDENYFDRVMTVMIASGMNNADLEKAIPHLPGPAIEYASFLNSTGQTEDAVIKYMDTLDLIDTFKNQAVFDQDRHLRKVRSLYFKIYHFFKTHNDLKNAMEVMERAEATLPMDARIKVALGDLYYQQGILYKAKDKYDHALLLEPGNRRALAMMKKIN
jgi:tetratricopeptide (TPR) repeat protein